MSLLGRLEDLSLTDIVQIVFLSRRTGILEIVNSSGRHTVLFRQGLIVNASSPDQPDLISYLHKRGLAPADTVKVIREMEERGIPCGNAVVEMNLLTIRDLADAVRERVLSVVTPLLTAREGEFNFLLSDSMTAVDVEYEPDLLFKEGGFSPQKILGAAEGEKLKPLQGLEDSLKAGKAFLRGDTPPVRPALDLGLGEKPAGEEPAAPPVPIFPPESDRLEAGESTLPAGTMASQFKVAGGLFEVESPEAAYRNVILFERDPLVRVAARRAFGKKGVKIIQYGTLDEVRNTMTDFFRANSFFITFLEITHDESSARLLQQMKRRNPRLPVVMMDSEPDLRRRHDLLHAGADLYLTRPSPARLQPGRAEEELSLFAEELVLFAERAFSQWEQLAGGLGPEAGRRFYEMADKENVDRSFGVLKQLINELSDPNDINEVASTILRLSSQYLDRGAIFVVGESAFTALGGFGVTGANDDMNARVRNLSLPRREPSILADVAASREPHRGKMRRTPANVQLIERLGGLLPTEVVALPIIHSGEPVGILYGDNAEHRAPIDSVAGLEIFLSQAGYALGNAVTASQKARPDGS
ncbi:MAG: response regulator [Thermoanaerobaculia bacterium]|nr:response regulator [Thermoanaerobaculia bacterium]